MTFTGRILYNTGPILLRFPDMLIASLLFKGYPMAVAPR